MEQEHHEEQGEQEIESFELESQGCASHEEKVYEECLSHFGRLMRGFAQEENVVREEEVNISQRVS